jgi:hypothetical protein
MTVRLTGQLSAGEVDDALYAVHFWTRGTQNHRYLREQINDPLVDFLQPECSKARFTIPARYAFRDELSQELGDDRDRTRDCRSCFSPRRSR